jgi:hypothetical protein
MSVIPVRWAVLRVRPGGHRLTGGWVLPDTFTKEQAIASARLGADHNPESCYQAAVYDAELDEYVVCGPVFRGSAYQGPS